MSHYPEMNTYTLEERVTKTTSFRRIEVKGTDNAVAAFTPRLPLGHNTSMQPPNDVRQAFVQDDSLPALPSERESITIENSDDSTKPDEPATYSNNSDASGKNLFNEDSKYGVIPSKKFRDHIQKLSSKKEKQQTFFIMYVWAYWEYKKSTVSREQLIEAVRGEGLFDSNTQKHVKETIKNYFKNDNGSFEITPYDGADKVKSIIENIENPNFTLDKPEQKSRKGGRPSGSLNKNEAAKIKPWLDKPIEGLDSFDVRKLDSAADWSVFGLYVLTKKMKVVEAVEANLLYSFLSHKYSSFPIKRKTFMNSFGNSPKRFIKNANNAYLLTQDSEKWIEKTIENNK